MCCAAAGSRLLGAEPFAGRVRRCVQNDAVLEPGIPMFPVARFDGVDELWFDRLDDAEAALASESYRDVVRPGLDGFCDPDASIAVVAGAR